MGMNRFWGRCRAVLSGAAGKRWVTGLVIAALALTGAGKSHAQVRDVDFDWMFTSITALVGQVAPSLTLNLVNADIDGNGLNEDVMMGALGAILRGNVGAYNRVTSINSSDAAQIRTDFASNRTVAGNDVQLLGLFCTVAQGLITLPESNCKLTTILRSDDVLGNVTGTFVGNLFLDLLAGYTTIGDANGTFNAVNTTLIEPIVQAALDALGQGGLYGSVINDFRLLTNISVNQYGHWGATPGGPAGYTRVNRFGSAGDLDGDSTTNATEYTTAAGDREAFLRSNTIGVYSSQNTDQPIRITTQPVSNVYPAGTNLNLTASFTGGTNATPYSYQWEEASNFGAQGDANYGLTVIANGGSYSGATTQTLTITNLTFADHDGKAPWLRISDQVTVYNNIPVGNGATAGSVEADGLGGRTTLFGQIKVVETLPRGPLQACTGTVLLTASASALNDSNDGDTDDDPPTYQWRFHATDPAQLQFASTNISGQTANTYTITAGAPAEGYYACATTVWSGTPTGGSLKTTVTNAVYFDFPTALPAAPSVPDLVAGSDSGSSPTDNITNDNTPTFTGTAEPNSTVTILANAVPVGTGTADLSGNWSITTSTLTDGSKSITATAANCVGTGPASAALNPVVIDTAAPAAPTGLDLATASDSGSSTSDDLTNVATPTITGSAEAGSTVSLRSSVTGVTVIGTGAAAPAFSIVTSTLSSAPPSVAHSLTATTTDVAGNTSVASTALVVTVDTTPPSVPSVPDMTGATDRGSSSSDNITSDNTPDFQITGDAGSTITIVSSVNGNVGSAAGPSATVTVSTLTSLPAPSVSHNITAFATDPAGNNSANSAALVAVIDTTLPAAPSIPDVTAGTDSGASSTDNVTNFQQPTFTGTAEAGATVTLFAPAAITPTSTGPNYSITPASPLAAGTYATVRARQVDLAGNQGPISTSMTPSLVIDTTAPAAPTALDLTTDSGVSGTDDVTNVVTPTFTGSGETGATATIISSINGTVGTGPVAAGAFSINTSTLNNALHNITATQTDLAGNTSLATSILPVTIDNVAPTVSSEVPVRLSNVANLPDVQVTFSSAVFGLAASNLTVNSSASTTLTGSGPYTFSGYTNPADGTVNIAVLSAGVTDLAGNALTADAWTYNKTGSSPLVTLTSGTVANNGSTNVSPVAFTATFSVPVTGFATGEVTVTGGTAGTISGGPSVYTFNVTPTGNGAVSVQVPASVANASAPPNAANLASLAYNFTFDNVAPAVTVVNVNTADATPPVSGTVDDASATINVSVASQNVAAINNGATWLLPDGTLSAIAEGTYPMTVTATDAAGNVGTANGTLEIDLTAPTVTINTLVTNDATPSLTGTVNETDAVVRISIAPQLNLLAVNNGNGTWTLADNTLTTLTDATYDVVADATDPAGNVGSDASAAELTIDTVAPIVTLNGPGSVTVSCGDGYADPSAIANDNRDGDVTASVIATPSIGVQTPPGTYNVNYTATDSAGNVSAPVVRVVTITNDCPLSFTFDSTPVEKQVGDDHTFEVTAANNIGTVTYQWKKDDGSKALQDISGETNSTLVLTDLQESDSGDYACEVSDAVTSVTTPTVTLTVINGVPAVGLAGLGLLAIASALGGALTLRRKR